MLNYLKQQLKKENIQLALLLVFFSIVFISLRSISYDDWDSIQFALGIENFDMSLHQPHPPGYPVYIFVLKVLNLVFKNPLNSMVFLSIASSLVGLTAFYFISRIIFLQKNKRNYLPIIATTLLAIFPLYALNSVKAMSDIFSLTFYLLWLLYFLRIFVLKDHKVMNYVLLGILSGISLGIRIQIITAILIPLIILVVYLLKDFKKYKQQFIALISSGVMSTLLWLIPSIIVSGGLVRYYKLLKGQYVWRYAIHAHTPFEYGFNIPYFFEHGFAHIFSFIRGGLGIPLPWSSASDIPRALLLFLVVFFTLGISYLLSRLYKQRKNLVIGTFFVSALPYLAFMYFNLNYENSRYWLPFVPWLVLLFAMSIYKIKKKQVVNVIIGIVILFCGLQSYTLLRILHTESSVPTQIIEFIEPTEDKTGLINCAHNNERHFQYLTDYEIDFIEDYTREDLLKLQNDSLEIYSCQCWKPLEVEGVFLIETYNFYRDTRVHWKHSYVEICEIGIE